MVPDTKEAEGGMKYPFIRHREIEESLSISQTTCVNGIFVLLVFLSHFCQYIDATALPFFRPFFLLRSILGQLIVAPFLFYSGYGVSEQIKKRGMEYVNAIPKCRILKTWIHFSMAVFLYWILSFLLKSQYSWKTILLSFTGWESIGNSNWYVFEILVLYGITYFSFKNLTGIQAPICCVVSTFINIIVMRFLKDGRWWYDTVLCYSAGIVFSCFKERILRYFNEKYRFSCAICMILTAVLFVMRSNLIAHELLGVLFCMDIILACAFVRIEHKILLFLGKHTFEIYILQRIPMMVFGRYLSGYVYMCVCLMAVILLAVVFKQVERKVDKLFKI